MALKTEDILDHAHTCIEMAAQVLTIAKDFDETGNSCTSCGSTHYNNFPQRNMRKRIEGVAERLTEIAETLTRRANDPVFLTGTIDGEKDEQLEA